MKTLINISLVLIFTMSFFSCEKERIMPVNQEDRINGCFDHEDDTNTINKSFSDDSNTGLDDGDQITDPDEEEDFDDNDKDLVTDPDEEEDFDDSEDNSK